MNLHPHRSTHLRDLPPQACVHAAGTPDFDPDSPDLDDPQIDPPTPAKVPESDVPLEREKRVDDDQYPPYDPAPGGRA